MREHDVAFALLDPDIEFVVDTLQVPDMRGTYRGHEGVREFWRSWLEAWSELQWTVKVEDMPDGRVRATVRQRNKSKGAGIWIDQPPYEQLWTIEDGKATRMELVWAE